MGNCSAIVKVVNGTAYLPSMGTRITASPTGGWGGCHGVAIRPPVVPIVPPAQRRRSRFLKGCLSIPKLCSPCIVLAYRPCSRTASSYSAPIPSPESSSGISRYRFAGLRLHAHVDQAGQG